jgi:hypothetical protein
MKKSDLFILMLLATFISLIFIYGCGSNPSGGGGSSSSGSPNIGTISGHVYVHDISNATYLPYQGAIVSVSSEAMSREVCASSDASGKYTLNSVPSGDVLISVTWEADQALSIATSLADVNFVIYDTWEAGSVTVRGTVEGFLGAPTFAGINVSFLSGNWWKTVRTWDPSTFTFEVTGLPANETVYISSVLDYGSGNYLRSYGRVDTTGGGVKYLNIDASRIATIDATFTHTSGTVSHVMASIENNYKSLRYLYDESVSGTTHKLSPLFQPYSGDYYLIEVWEDNAAGDIFEPRFWGISTGTQAFDLSTYTMPSSFVVFPTTQETFTTSPTFEWNAVSSASRYEVNLWNRDESFHWLAYTNDNKIKFPPNILNLMTNGSYEVSVVAVKFSSYPGNNKLNEFSTNAYVQYELVGNSPDLIKQ